MPNEYIQIIDDEDGMCQYLSKLLGGKGYDTDVAGDGQKGLAAIKKRLPDLVLVDFKMPKMDGLEFMEKFKALHPEVPVIMMTAYATLENGIQAMKLGAYDFVTKPFEMEQILLVIEKALEKKRLEEENAVLRLELKKTYSFEDVISRHEKMQKNFELVRKIADSKSPALIYGEKGTGRELMARAVHNLSPRKGKEFVVVDCDTLNQKLLDGELFGYTKGVYAGATTGRIGALEAADGGTVLLSEVSQIPLAVQTKLQRFLEDGQFDKLGSKALKKSDVRLLATTNDNLTDMVKAGKFREDLFYSLNVVPIQLPPLRDRKEDIPLLVEYFIKKYNRLEKQSFKEISQDVLNILMKYHWPGNIRELENLIHRCVVMGISSIFKPEDLPAELNLSPTAEKRDPRVRTLNFRKARAAAMEQFESRFLNDALNRHGGNVSKASREVGMDRRNFQRKIKQYGLEPSQYKTRYAKKVFAPRPK